MVRALIDRLRHRFDGSVAEVGDQNHLKSALIGIALVSEEARHASEMMDSVIDLDWGGQSLVRERPPI